MEPTYAIEEASELTGVSRHTLRYYERIGLLPAVGRGSNGHRRYSDDDLGWIRFLTLLRETGMPIRNMQRFVELTRAGDQTVPQRVEVLDAHRDALRERLALLTQHLAAIENKIGVYRALLAAGESTPGSEPDPDNRHRNNARPGRGASQRCEPAGTRESA